MRLLFSLMFIRILLFTVLGGSGSLFKVMRMCDHCSTDPSRLHLEPPWLHFEPPRLQSEHPAVQGPSRLRIEALKLLTLMRIRIQLFTLMQFYADPDQQFCLLLYGRHTVNNLGKLRFNKISHDASLSFDILSGSKTMDLYTVPHIFKLRRLWRPCTCCDQGWKKPGFFKKKPAQWFFCFFLGFLVFVFFWVFWFFFGFFAQKRGY